MVLESICKDPNISEDARWLIESGLAPCFISSDSELYSLKHLMEAIDEKAFIFSEADEKRLKVMNEKATYIELPVPNLRQFLPR